MPLDPRSNKTSYSPRWPLARLVVADLLKRETTSSPDDLKAQARTLNILALELERLQEVLGLFPGWVSGTTMTDLVGAQLFGDGSDGDVTIAAPTSLTQDMYYDNLTVSSTLTTDGYRVFVRGTLTIDIGGSIINNGDNAAAGVGGAGAPAGSLGAGAAGGNATANGSNRTNSRGGAGGDGGGAGGTGGTVAANPAGIRDAAVATTLFDAVGAITGGAGGGGGVDAGQGGGGGGGGGVLMIAAKRIINAGTIAADGGDGANAAGAPGGGGGGGGGGLVVLVTRDITDSGVISAFGGALGTGAGGDGLAGADGEVAQVIL